MSLNFPISLYPFGSYSLVFDIVLLVVSAEFFRYDLGPTVVSDDHWIAIATEYLIQPFDYFL